MYHARIEHRILRVIVQLRNAHRGLPECGAYISATVPETGLIIVQLECMTVGHQDLLGSGECSHMNREHLH